MWVLLMSSFGMLLQPLLLITALTIDPIISGYSCGKNRITISFLSVATISLISNLILILSLFLGAALQYFLPGFLMRTICFLSLLGLGMVKVFDCPLKILIQNYSMLQGKVVSPFHLDFFSLVYTKPEQSNLTHSGSLSPIEAAYLSLAFSADEFIAGFSTGMSITSPLLVTVLTYLSSFLAFRLSSYLGKRVSNFGASKLCLISGSLFIILAILKLP